MKIMCSLDRTFCFVCNFFFPLAGSDLPTGCTLQVKLESNFASIVFAIMVLEGLGRSLDPSLDILELAKPLLLKNYTSLL